MQKKLLVKDIMIPLEQYATVPEDASLYDAILALEEVLSCVKSAKDCHRAVLVVTRKGGHVIGKVSQLDVIRSLEPSYGHILAGPAHGSGRVGFSNRFLKLLADDYKLWKEPL